MPKPRRYSPTPPAGIPDLVRSIIAGRGLTAYSVARSAGVALSVVSRFLTRERGLSLDTFDAIAGALGLRLVEPGRGKGRPARSAGQPPGAVGGGGPGEVPSGIAGPAAAPPDPAETDHVATWAGALYCPADDGEAASPGDVPDGTRADDGGGPAG